MNIKKLLALLLVIVMLVSVAASCSKGDDDTSSRSKTEDVDDDEDEDDDEGSSSSRRRRDEEDEEEAAINEDDDAEEATDDLREALEAPAVPVEAPKPVSNNGFDQRLRGGWVYIDGSHDGDEVFELGDEIFFLYDGSFYGDELLGSDPADLYSIGFGLPKTKSASGEIDLIAAVLDYLLSLSADLGIDPADMPEINLTTTFEVSDAQASQNEYATDSTDNYFAKYDNDLLTIHISGTYEADALTTYSIDTTLVYEKLYPLGHEDFFEVELIGTWADNRGGTWEFAYGIAYRQTVGIRMTDSRGNAYESPSMLTTWSDADPDCVEIVDFRLPGVNSVFEIVAYDGITLTLRSDSTTDLVLTRVA